MCCTDAGDDEETKKQKQKALIDAAFKLTVKTENTEKNNSNGNVDGLEDSADGKFYVNDCTCIKSCLQTSLTSVMNGVT